MQYKLEQRLMTLSERVVTALPAELRDQILLEMPCGLCVVRQDERASFVFANEIFFQMLGYENERQAAEEGFLGLLDRMEQAACSEPRSRFQALFSGAEQAALLEIRLKKRNGEAVWVMLHARRMTTGEPLLLCACLDISERKAREEELRFREEEYRVAVQQSDKLVFRYDIACKTAYLSPELAEYFHRDVVPDAIVRIEHSGIISPASMDAFRDLGAMIQSGAVRTGSAILQFRLGTGTTSFEWYRVVYSLIYREDQTPAQAVFSMQNVSEQHEREVAYKRWEQTYAAMALDKTAYIEFDLTQNRLELQKGGLIERFPPLEEQTLESAMQYFLEQWVHPEDREKLCDCIARDRLLAAYFRGVTPEKLDYRHLRGNGTYEWVRFSVQMLPDPYSSNIRVSFLLRDIDARKREELHLQNQLRSDPLTGALNRSAFIAQADAIFAEGLTGKHALIILDVDHFKQVNDCFGHGYGDRVLIRVAETLRAALRADDLVGRLGGDEFLVLLRNVSKKEILEAKLENIRELLFQRVSEDKIVSCSLGAAVFPCDGTTFDELYRKTDIALYAAKNAGRNCVQVYQEEMNPPIKLFEAGHLP
jgi:diguanylate cyclase (GGDEF)-like protein/PAS domain S-box-containing protein